MVLALLRNTSQIIIIIKSYIIYTGGGVIGIPQQSIYSASKHAVLGMTKSTALEYAKYGIRINAIAPGVVETEMLERISEDNKQLIESIKSRTPIGRIGDHRRL